MSSVAPSCRDLGSAHMHGRLFDLGAFPGLQVDREADVVHGELYGVDDAALERLDEIEQYFTGRPEESYYVRIPVSVIHIGVAVECWTYEFNPRYFDTTVQIDSGDWISYFAAKVGAPEERWPDGKLISK
jgi:gamma-glutamylcyclotransferase (GGCT)/AIG2-like uncharacterized protein YtfP